MTRSRRVLLVDDSTDLLELYEPILESEGYQVDTAASVDEAIAKIRTRRPDLVVTDIVMPERSGFELITWIRSDLPPPLPPIIALSGFPDVGDEALRRGASAFQVKPLDIPELLELVASAFEERLDQIAPKISAAAEGRRQAAARDSQANITATLAEHPDFADRLRVAARLLSNYFDRGIVVALALVGDQARVLCSSHPEHFAEGAAADRVLGGVVDVIVSRSSLVLSDHALAAALGADDQLGSRPLASAPLIAADRSVLGSLAIFGGREIPFDGADLRIVERFARFGSIALSNVDKRPLVRGPSQLLRREHWQFLLQQELAHLAAGKSLGISIIEIGDELPPAEAFRRVQMAFPPRTSLGHLAERQLGVFCLSTGLEAVRGSLASILLDVAGSVGFERAAIVLFEGLQPPQDAGALLEITEANLPEIEEPRREVVSSATLRSQPVTPRTLRRWANPGERR